MDSIKKFFEKKKKDVKFKVAGEGKKLSGPSSSGSSSRSKSCNAHYAPNQRFAPTAEAQRAGAAALARFESKTSKEVDWSLQAIKAQARREMEAEKKMADLTLKSEPGSAQAAPSKDFEGSPMLAVDGVFFHCPLIGPEVGTYDEIRSQIRELLFSQLGEDKGVASCLIIHTCNKNKEKIALCVETLCKYIDNIESNPSESKYRKIRQSNRAFEDRIAPREGTKEFLESAGFEQMQLPFNDGEEMFWVFPEDKSDFSALASLRDTLVSAEPLKPQLDRSRRVFLLKEALENTDLPPEFFAMSIEELKKEMQLRSEAVERSQMLMTKVMREKMEMREMRRYRFTLIRVRFPYGVVLQGTFAVGEKLSCVFDFVRENLSHDWRPFFLSLGTEGKLTEEDMSLLELHLVPAVILNFEWDPSVQDPNLDDGIFLKEEILMPLYSGD